MFSFVFDCAAFCVRRASYHFRCPRCFVKCQPFAWSPDKHDASNVIAFCDPLAKRWTHFTASFGNTLADNWVREQCVAYARARVAQVADVSGHCHTSLYRLSDTLAQLGSPDLFKKLPYTTKDANVDQTVWDDSHLRRQGGYWGSRVSPEVAAQPVFTQWDLLIELFGNVIAGGAAAAGVTGL